MKHGILNFKQGGDVLAKAQGDFTYILSGTQNEAIEGEGQDPLLGVSVKDRIGKIKGKVVIDPGVDRNSVTDFEGDLTLELRGGEVVSLTAGKNIANSEITAKDGTVDVEFVGTKCQLIRN